MDKDEKQLEAEKKKIEDFNNDYLEICKKHGVQLIATLDMRGSGIVPIFRHVEYKEDNHGSNTTNK